MVGRMSTVTVAPVTSTVHGLATEVAVGSRNGLDHEGAVKCDRIVSIPIERLHGQSGGSLRSKNSNFTKRSVLRST